MLQEILLHLISFLGLITGFFVSHYSWDEMQKGDKYFRIASNILLILIAVGLIYRIQFETHHFALIILGVILGIIIKWRYLYLGLGSVASLLSGNFILIPALIFLYGLPDGTLSYYHHKREKLKRHTILRFVFYLIPLIFFIFPVQGFLLNAFAAGAIITQIR